MLLRFSVENFMSFKERAELSLIPSRVRRHPNHVIKGANANDISVLKAAVIYGANASGKSNLIKAMKHAQNMINLGVKSGRKLPYHPFKLDTDYQNKPSRFEFEVKFGKNNYAYGFLADSSNVIEEWLYKIDRKKDTLIFERKLTQTTSSFDLSGISFKKEDDKKFLEFTAKGTPSNRLFINECQERNVVNEINYLEGIIDIGNWFEHRLNIVFPNSKYSGLEMDIQNNEKTSDVFSKILNSFDTGISKLSLQEIDFDKEVLGIPEEVIETVVEEIDNNVNVLLAGPNNTRYQICKSDTGDIRAFKLMTAHINSNGKDVLFDINQESDGTQRLLDIAPGLLDIFSTEKTYVIDELDRSLHPDITTSIFKAFLSNTSKLHSQLLVTTHESNLLNQELMRKDEVWFVQKDKKGESQVYSLEEYQPRFDNDIRKGYLSGRFGGVPVLPKFENLSWMNSDA